MRGVGATNLRSPFVNVVLACSRPNSVGGSAGRQPGSAARANMIVNISTAGSLAVTSLLALVFGEPEKFQQGVFAGKAVMNVLAPQPHAVSDTPVSARRDEEHRHPAVRSAWSHCKSGRRRISGCSTWTR